MIYRLRECSRMLLPRKPQLRGLLGLGQVSEWKNPKALADDFQRAMSGPIVKGNSAEVIDYSGLKVGQEFKVDKQIALNKDKC